MKEVAPCLSNIPHVTRTQILSTDKFLIMASDVVWDVISDEDLYQLLTSKEKIKSNQDYAKSIVQEAIDKWSLDNISCIAIKLN